MCFLGRSRFCLFCLLLYTWLPHGVHPTPGDELETATYSSVRPPLNQHSDGDQELHQLRETRPEVLEKEFYLNKLMEEFGNGSVITFEGFEHLLHKLGLGKVLLFDHPVDCHKSDNSSDFQSFHQSHNHSAMGSGSKFNNSCKEAWSFSDTNRSGIDPPYSHVEGNVDKDTEEATDHHHTHTEEDHDHHHHTDEDVDDHDHDHEKVTESSVHKTNTAARDDNGEHGSHSKRHIPSTDNCLLAPTFLYISESEDLYYLSKDTFRDLCPSLIYQISHDTCHEHHTDLVHIHNDKEVGGHDNVDHPHDDKLGHGHSHGEPREESLSRVPAKVWGFSTIAVVIISLVGLLGVAVIPIMQKVFYNHMLQFLVALAVGALSGDALLHLLPHAISGGHGDEVAHSAGGEGESGHVDAVYKGLCGLIGIYFFYLIERILTIFTEIKRRKKQSKNRKIHGADHLEKVGEKLAADCDEMMMSVHPNRALRGYAAEAHSEHCMISFENSSSISHQHGNKHQNSHGHTDTSDVTEEEVDMLSRSGSHGHGHSHCIEGAPNSIAAIAWMVILGDGIHNFSDGLAIGAAFSNSITGGFSTSIAVFCHELPHEIGDFAMLLRAGMAPKQAIIYNCLSSVLCFIGMLIGVAIGNLENASLWIFAVVGGMFLYIALVDMLPEMSSVEPKQGENPFCHLMLQLAGMMLGGGIMLVIALHEDALKTVFD